MKRILTLAAATLLGIFTASADNDRPITVDRLPQAAQAFIRQYFPDATVSYAKEEREFVKTEYTVRFADASKIEFDKAGNWKEVDCKRSAVPAAIVPAQIAAYVAQHYPDAAITAIERNRREYEIKLSNRLELTFDMKFNLIDIDD